MNAHMPASTRQRGASLVVSLIMLVLLTLIGVSALTVSNTQSRLAGNIVLQTRAAQEADSALSQAENWLSQHANTATLLPFDGATPGLGKVGNATVDALKIDWTDANSRKISDTQRYIIEVYANNVSLSGNSMAICDYNLPAQCPYVNVFRVTARGAAPGGATRFVQSVFAVRVNRN